MNCFRNYQNKDSTQAWEWAKDTWGPVVKLPSPTGALSLSGWLHTWGYGGRAVLKNGWIISDFKKTRQWQGSYQRRKTGTSSTRSMENSVLADFCQPCEFSKGTNPSCCVKSANVLLRHKLSKQNHPEWEEVLFSFACCKFASSSLLGENSQPKLHESITKCFKWEPSSCECGSLVCTGWIKIFWQLTMHIISLHLQKHTGKGTRWINHKWRVWPKRLHEWASLQDPNWVYNII